MSRFVCVECGELFEESQHFVEKHGFTYPPYEEWYGCPHCGGAFVDAFRCEYCGEYITDRYIQIEDGKRYCVECYRERDLEDDID